MWEEEMIHLLKLMLREEYRLHVSYSSRTIFMAMPLFVAVVSFFLGVTMNNLEENVPLSELLILTNMGIFLYGLSVGAFGFLGRTHIERREGKINFLVAMPTILPISFRRTFLGMFLRDVIFYLAIILLPALGGLLLATPIAGFDLISVGAIMIPIFLSFLYGISLSFAISVIFTRNLPAFLVVVITFVLAIAGHAVGLYGLDMVLPSFGLQFVLPPFQFDAIAATAYIMTSILLSLVLVAVAVILVKERYESSRSSFEELLPTYISRFSFMGRYQSLVAKEFVDLIRSGTIWKMTFSFVAPLVFLSLTTWYVNNGLGIPVGFNTVFYAAMVGFFGILMYSWLTNVDTVDYYETLPVTFPMLIRTKLIVFFLITSGISTIFVLAIAFLNGELDSLWLSLPVLYIMSAYMVIATAYLTGISPQSFLFNPQILTKFTVVSILPDLCLTILSFSLDSTPVLAGAGIGIVCLVLLICTVFFHRGIERKWESRPWS
jgi:hypothetical protein